MLQKILNYLWSLLPVTRGRFYSELNRAGGFTGLHNLEARIIELHKSLMQLEASKPEGLEEPRKANMLNPSDLAYLGSIKVNFILERNRTILSYDLRISKDGKQRAVTPFCPGLPSELLNSILAIEPVFLNVVRPWIMGAPDEILLPHISFSLHNPELPEHYQKFAEENNDANKLLLPVLKKDSK